MRRADRLFQIVQILRNRRSVTARFLAERLQVSERTIYRDIQDLSLSGVPIEGEAGVGYILRHSIDIPPLMFSEDEIQALVLGARMVGSWGGQELAKAAQNAVDKIEGVLPQHLKKLTEASHLYSFPYDFEQCTFSNIDILRNSINQKKTIRFQYTKLDKTKSERDANPLALYFWGRNWTLTSWCHLRKSFRNFRIDRMEAIDQLDGNFSDIPGQRIEDYIDLMKTCYDDLGTL